MPTDTAGIDPDTLKAAGQQIFGHLKGALISAMIHLGDVLGLYRALRGAGPMNSQQLADKTGLHERWVREWIHGQAAAGLIGYHGNGQFELSAEMGVLLADESSPKFAAGIFSDLPQRMMLLERLSESFRTGLGLPYDARGAQGARGIERVFGPWFRTALVPTVLPALDGVTDKLRTGGRAADVGCGAGVAVLEMAKAYPRSEFHGYDISQHALARAEENKRTAGLTNVTFHNAKTDGLPDNGSLDFITTFDCIHDMTDPAGTIRAIRAALRSDGTWFIADINTAPTFEENLKNPLTGMFYAFSVMGCMSSAMSEPGGAGLGTLGFNEQVARKMATEAGFGQFKRHDFENPFNAYYEVRP